MLDTKEKRMKDKAKTGIVELQDTNQTERSLTLHEQHNTGYEVSAIPHDVC